MLFGQEHVDRYIATDGQEGHEWQGTRTLLLTTTGRRTGRERTSPLIYGVDGGDYVIVASKGGTPEHPRWYTNLQTDPHVTVQVLGERFKAVARTAEGDERARLWQLMVGEWPAYDNYQKRTEREIPVVVLERE